MMTSDDLYAILKPHVQNVSGQRLIIPARSNVPSPKGSYGAINVKSATGERGQANIVEKFNKATNQVDTEIFPQVLISCEVEFFRDRAYEYASNLLQFGKHEHVQWDLNTHKIGVRGTSGVLDLSALQSSNYEERAKITIELWGSYSQKYSTNIITNVGINVLNEKGTLIQSTHVYGDTQP